MRALLTIVVGCVLIFGGNYAYGTPGSYAGVALSFFLGWHIMLYGRRGDGS